MLPLKSFVLHYQEGKVLYTRLQTWMLCCFSEFTAKEQHNILFFLGFLYRMIVRTIQLAECLFVLKKHRNTLSEEERKEKTCEGSSTPRPHGW